jgi:PhnB protein
MSKTMNSSAKGGECLAVATPYLSIKDAASAIEFYQQAFGAVETMRLRTPDGKIVHAQIKIGQALVMMADADGKYHFDPQALGGSSVSIHLYVEDVDAFVSRAVAVGAKVVIPVNDQFYGDRTGRLVDPFGHVWIISTHKEDVSPEEMQKRFAALSNNP